MCTDAEEMQAGSINDAFYEFGNEKKIRKTFGI